MKKQNQSLKDYFIEELTNEILASSLKPGDKLKSIRELASTHHVSRSVILNGLKEMTDNGLIEKDENNHYIVSSIKKYNRIETILYFLNFTNSSLNDLERKSILEIKYGMDALAIDLLIGKLKEEDYLRLNSILDIKIGRANEAFSHLASLEYFKFMKELYLLTNNMIMTLFINAFINPILLLIEDYCNETKYEDLFISSKRMLKALYEGKLEEAKAYSKERFLS